MQAGVVAIRGVSSLFALAAALLLASCGGGGGGEEAPPPTYTIGGTVSGLSGTGLILQNSGGNNLAVSANGSFAFNAGLLNGASYSVTVFAQPTNLSQTCAVTSGSGTVAGANVTNVTVTCVTNTFTVGGTVSGSNNLGLTLRLNGNPAFDQVGVVNGNFTFPAIPDGSVYNVAVFVQPPGQTCAVADGIGTLAGANVSNVAVSCSTNTYAIGGTVSGLAGTGLVLRNNGGNDLVILANGDFVFSTPISHGQTYSVTVFSQPSSPAQTCLVANGSGTATTNVSNVTVICTTNTYTVGGTVSGLAGSGLVLRNNGGDNLAIPANGVFTFATPIASGAIYSVSVFTQPSNLSQTCTVVSNGSGTVINNPVTNVSISCTTNSYGVSVTVSGLSGSGLILQNNGVNNLAISNNGAFSFTTPILSGGAYSVTVLSQPVNPSQTCSVPSPSGTVTGASVNLAVNCSTNTYTIGGSITALTGQNLKLRNNGGDELTVASGATSFTFATPIASGAGYNVSVSLNPDTPNQTCSVSSGQGTVSSGPVTSVIVTCATTPYTIGGTVSGLAGTGLVLKNNGGNDLSISGNGDFTFATAIADGSPYAVTVATQPTGLSQTCTVTNGSGTLAGANVTNVAVNCATNSFSIGGTVSGLVGTGLVLQNNGGNNRAISANGAFSFSALVADGANYAVTVLTQPSTPSQTCTVTSGTGTVAGASITNVAVTCGTHTFSIGGTVGGLAGSGLVLRNNGTDNLAISAIGVFTFATPIASGATYNVTVFQQPTNLNQTCTVNNGSGTVGGAHVTGVSVSCTTNTYTVGGTVSGSNNLGLTLRLNGTTNLSGVVNGNFAFPAIADGSAYSVTVFVNPPGQTCSVTNGSGALAGANVTNVAVSCANNTYTVGGTVSGLAGSGLVLRNNGGNNLAISANGAFTFTTPIASGNSYNVTVFTQPTNLSQTCTVTNGSGTVSSDDITTVNVSCMTNNFTVGGTVSGHNGTGLTLRLNGTTNLPVSGNGTYAFPPLVDGSSYSVAVFVNPIGQTCSVSNPSGTLTGANVTNVNVSCLNLYTIGGTVSGLAGSGLVLRNNGGNDLAISGNGSFTFGAPVTDGSAYAVTVLTQPSNLSQTCTVTNGSGNASANVTNVAVTCTTNSYTIGGPVSGLLGTGLVLQNNGGDNRSVAANATSYTFATPILSGASYAVTVLTQPTNPSQTCTVANPSGTIGGANVTDVAITCVTNTYTIGGTVSFLVGAGLVLQNNGGNNLAISANGAFTFTTPIASGAAYAVTILTHPSGQTCVISNGSGTVVANNVTNVGVACVSPPPAPTVSLAFGPKELRFSWPAVNGADFYKLFEDPDGVSGYINQPGGNLTTLSYNHTIAVHRRLNAKYIVEACNIAGCTASAAQILGANLTQAIGYAKASNTGDGDAFGAAMALSGDGNTLAVGARREDGNANGINNPSDEAAPSAGAVYVFRRVGGVWSQEAYVKASSSDPDDLFGYSLSLSNDGNTLAVGAIFEDSSTTGINTAPDEAAADAGAAYVFARSGSTWSQQAYVKASNTGSLDRFGYSVALSGDGDTLAVGAAGEASNATGINGDQTNNSLGGAGAVYVFTRSAGTWSQQAYVKASNTDGGDEFGSSVALSADGNTLAVGAALEDGAGTGVNPTPNNALVDSGAVYVFARNAGVWSQQAYVKASNTGVLDLFGTSVALSGDGNTLAVGAPQEDSNATGVGGGSNELASNAGAVYVLTRSGTTWTPQAYVKASNTGALDNFGVSVALSSDGSTLAVGASGEASGTTGIGTAPDEAAAGAGAAYVFTVSGGTWSQQAYVKASNTGAGDLFGASVGLSSDGSTLAVGASAEASSTTGLGTTPNEAAPGAGAAYLY